ncbi:MAG: thermonuclease family protein [Ignavibacteriae bacterium]|nr:thermonuclease family protein [Ignavibacteriota bacterium]
MYTYKGKVIRVIDGDSVEIEIDLGFNIKFTEKARLLGINAPEKRGKNFIKGLESLKYLSDKILDKNVIIKTEKDTKGKFGRYLVTILLNDENINEWMIKNNHAVKAKY